jgi:hypothetical protein
MMRRRRARIVLGAGLAAVTAGSTLAALAPAQAATTPGWRLVSAIHQGPVSGSDELFSVVAPTKTDSWAFGGADLSGGTSGTPIAQRTGPAGHWRAADLPGGLTGSVSAASAPGPKDIWAVTGLTGLVLHYNGTKWSVAKRFTENQGLPLELTGVTAFSPTNVWVFGGSGAYPGFGAWHLHGTTWTKVTGVGAAIARASALSAASIWAIGGNASAPQDIVEHYNGSTWRQQHAAALANVQYSGIVALSSANVWATGSVYTDNSNVPWLLHFNGQAWSRVKVPWALLPGQPVSDGAGGLWFTGEAIATGNWYAVHRSKTGAWHRYLITKTGQAPALGLIPGTTSLWAAGTTSDAAGAGTAIWAYGAVG